jgi:hypothetical protein
MALVSIATAGSIGLLALALPIIAVAPQSSEIARRTVAGRPAAEGCGLDLESRYSSAWNVVFYDLINRCSEAMEGRIRSDRHDESFFVRANSRMGRAWIEGKSIVAVEVSSPSRSALRTDRPGLSDAMALSIDRNLKILESHLLRSRSEYANPHQVGAVTSEYAEALAQAEVHHKLFRQLMDAPAKSIDVAMVRLSTEIKNVEQSSPVRTGGRSSSLDAKGWSSLPISNVASSGFRYRWDSSTGSQALVIQNLTASRTLVRVGVGRSVEQACGGASGNDVAHWITPGQAVEVGRWSQVLMICVKSP